MLLTGEEMIGSECLSDVVCSEYPQINFELPVKKLKREGGGGSI